MVYFYIHIGKTAGTSFRKFLEYNLKNFHGYSNTNENFLLEVKKNNYELYSRHMWYNLKPHKYLPKNQKYKYITIFREPITRTLSAYNYGIDRKSLLKNYSFIEWSKNTSELEAYQINHICNKPENQNINYKINSAIKNISKNSFMFGFVENFNEYVDLCCYQNNWKPKYDNTNKSTHHYKLTNSDIEYITDLLKYEIEFYNKIKNLHINKYINLASKYDYKSDPISVTSTTTIK